MTTERLPITATIITLNVEDCLAECLLRLQFCQEILVVDSGSTDKTRSIAAEFGATVLEQAWLGFGPQKQWAVDHAKFDWILSIDSDEWITPTLEQSIRQLFGNIPDPTIIYQLNRRNCFLNRYLRHGEGFPDRCDRLFHRHHARWSDDVVHERVIDRTNPLVEKDLPTTSALRPSAKPAKQSSTSAPQKSYRRQRWCLAGELLHHSADNLSTYIQKQNRYASLLAERAKLKPGNAWQIKLRVQLVLSPLTRFIKFYFFKLGFLDGSAGLIHIAIGCFASFMKYAKLIERCENNHASHKKIGA